MPFASDPAPTDGESVYALHVTEFSGAAQCDALYAYCGTNDMTATSNPFTCLVGPMAAASPDTLLVTGFACWDADLNPGSGYAVDGLDPQGQGFVEYRLGWTDDLNRVSGMVAHSRTTSDPYGMIMLSFKPAN